MKARLALLATACLVTGMALAEPPQSRSGPDMDRIAILLELNDQQKSQVQDILNAQREQMRAQWQKQRDAGTRPTREEMQQRHESMQQDMMSKLQPVLTPEQLQKFKALHELRRGHGHYRGKPCGGNRPTTDKAAN